MRKDKSSDRKSSAKESSEERSYNWGKSSRHHIISRTVGGPDVPENIYDCPVLWHQTWHQLFHNYLPSVVIRIIKSWMDKNGNLSKEKILEYVLKEEKNPKGVEKKAEKIFKEWKRAFDRESPQGVINFIETEFLPVEKKFLDGEI
ncbi:MAG: hypothetical protein COV69_00145 [Parcubacteria group bacterium CG11_big_fil_rev_8_21_14_0_20_39_14]|nr:MAG: hypothetical protein COV69_00145 [Parcubacteria group bacterium CG11_big_fil_rev_8_21_14_0_20_39_14]PIS35277.1 MAG: hypothetical protein COT36_03340 [Parcubacteria group bacterium CG08_land_8_20_14_0_20_38_56]